MQVAIFGAAGPIGKSIADALHVRGMAYRAIGRDRARLESAFGANPLMELMTWDPDDAASVQAAAAGIDTLIFCVGVPYDTESFSGGFRPRDITCGDRIVWPVLLIEIHA
jgi:uncharacterized protein YbjT (DUF2867 family)